MGPIGDNALSYCLSKSGEGKMRIFVTQVLLIAACAAFAVGFVVFVAPVAIGLVAWRRVYG